MNTHIQQLIEKAYEEVHTDGGEYTEFAEFEKLAELIAKDCLEVIKGYIYGPAGQYDYSYSSEDSSADNRAESIFNAIKSRYEIQE